MTQKYHSRHTAGKALGVKPRTVTKYIRLGWLTAVRIGRRFVIEAASVERLLFTGSCPCGTKRPSAPQDKGGTCAQQDGHHV